jgi:hypothetical protein
MHPQSMNQNYGFRLVRNHRYSNRQTAAAGAVQPEPSSSRAA